MRRGQWVRVALLVILLAPAAPAQSTTTTLYGTVTDKTGAVVANAEVTATNTGTNLARTAKTGDTGEYRIEFLPVGKYDVQVSAGGFKKSLNAGIVLQVNQTARLDVTLDVGSVTEVVNVTEQTPLINTNNAEIGRTVENAEIINLPLVNRNVYTLLSLTPGVQSNANSIVLGFPEQRTMINGGVDGGAGSVSYFLDGGTNMTGLRNTGNVLPNPDAIQEFRVQTNSYSAEMGRYAGGVVNAITKSGTNQFHGSLFWFYRDTAFNARDWGATADSPLHRNQFGATLGGPIKHDKIFFFGSYSGLRQTTSTFMNSAIVPTALERQGNFSQSRTASGAPVTLRDPTTGQQFSCNGVLNAICPNRQDPAAMNIINQFIPASNSANNFWQGSIPSPFDTDDYLAKVDWAVTQKHLLTMSYFNTGGENVIRAGTGNLPWSRQQFKWRQHNVNVSDVWTISPTLVNQGWFSYTRQFGGRLNLPGTSLGDLGSAFTIQGTPSLPQITVNGFFTLTNAIAGPNAGTNFYSLRDVASWTKGRHALKLGGEASLNKDIQQTLLNNYGVFGFNGTATSGAFPASGGNPAGTATGSALADFIIGVANSASQDAPVTAYTNTWNFALFAQDDWRIHPRLTFNLGVRWDIQTPPTDPQDRQATFIQGVQSTVVPAAPRGHLYVGDPQMERGTVPVRWHHVSPRIGLAWDPFGGGKTSVRAAFGVFYGSVSGNEWNTVTNFQPFSTRFTFTNIAANGSGLLLSNPYRNLSGGNPFPFIYDPASPRYVNGGSIYAVSTDFQWAYSYQLNLSVQRQITSDFSAGVAYVGTLSHNLPFTSDVNYPVLNATATTAAANILSRRPINTGVSGPILFLDSKQSASYHGLQLTATKRMGRHWMLNSFYTFSKTLTTVQLQNSTTQGGAQNFTKLFLDNGRGDTDARHNFVAAATWDISYYSGGNKVAAAILNGWSISPIITLRSGLPLTITNGVDSNLDGNNNDRARLVPGLYPVLDPNRSRAQVSAQWFLTQGFAQNCAKTSAASTCVPAEGDSPRNFIDAPGFRNVDLAIFRDFRFTESLKLQFRAEASNAFNMVSLSNPGTQVGTSTFGVIRTANPMRQMQFGLRLTF